MVAISGFNYFYLHKEFITFTFIITVFIGFFRKYKISPKELIFFFVIVSLEIFQSVYFNFFSLNTVIGIILRLLVGYIIIKITKDNFIRVFINIIYFFAIVSIPFFLALLFTNSVNTLLEVSNYFSPLSFLENAMDEKIYPNVIVYTFNTFFIYDEVRNSGPFCEPGMFAVYLNIAFLFNIIVTKKVFTLKNIFFIIVILTTVSTAGYIAFFIIMMGVYLKFNKVKNIVYFIVFFILSVYLFNSLPFLSNKIEKNIADKDETTSSRFGSFVADLYLIQGSPIIGYGRNVYEIIGLSKWDVAGRHRNNGISKLIVYYGIIFTIYYFILLKKSLSSIIIYYNSKYSSWTFLLVILSLGFSQIIFQFPYFLSFPFLAYTYSRKQIIN